MERTSRCERHKLSLAIELGANGFKNGEWFCRDFDNTGRANEKAMKEFETVLPTLKGSTLYGGYGENKQLKEISFAELTK